MCSSDLLKDKVYSLANPNFANDGTDPTKKDYCALVKHFKFNINFAKPIRIRFNASNAGTVADIVVVGVSSVFIDFKLRVKPVIPEISLLIVFEDEIIEVPFIVSVARFPRVWVLSASFVVAIFPSGLKVEAVSPITSVKLPERF